MDLGGYTGYAPHCTVGRVTKAPPFCNCEQWYFGNQLETKFSVRPSWYQHYFHHARQQSCMNCLMHANRKLEAKLSEAAFCDPQVVSKTPAPHIILNNSRHTSGKASQLAAPAFI